MTVERFIVSLPVPVSPLLLNPKSSLRCKAMFSNGFLLNPFTNEELINCLMYQRFSNDRLLKYIRVIFSVELGFVASW